MPLNVITYKDIDPNFNINPVTKDVPVITAQKAVIASIENLLFTDHYEVPFHPEIGSNLKHMLFEPITPITASTIYRYITETLQFEPRVKIKSLVVTANIPNNGYDIILEFYIQNLSNPVVISTFLEKIR